MTERVTVPLNDDNLPTAAAVYLAVLAFPERTDWRDDFLLAVMAAAKQPRINARRIAAIDRVAKRLRERMQAVDIARPVMARAGLQSLGMKLRLKAKGQRPFAPTIYKGAEVAAGLDGYGHLLGRQWQQTKPVLHLAIAFDNHASNGKSVLWLIRNPEWVRPAVKGSRALAAAIRRAMPSVGELVEIDEAL